MLGQTQLHTLGMLYERLTHPGTKVEMDANFYDAETGTPILGVDAYTLFESSMTRCAKLTSRRHSRRVRRRPTDPCRCYVVAQLCRRLDD
jgi:hypothetical protein